MPGLHPGVPHVGSQPSSLGISVIVAQCLGSVSARSPQCPGAFPGLQVEPWSSEMWAKLTKACRSSAEQGQAVPKMLDAWTWPVQNRYMKNSLT